jgi:hypothetical protein
MQGQILSYGVQVACGIDIKATPMAYGRIIKKPAIGWCILNKGTLPIAYQ